MSEPHPEDIQRAVARYIGDTLLRGKESEDLTPTVNLFASGLVDSLGAMKLVSWIEATYEQRIPPVDLVPENLQSVEVIADYIAGLLEEKSG